MSAELHPLQKDVLKQLNWDVSNIQTHGSASLVSVCVVVFSVSLTGSWRVPLLVLLVILIIMGSLEKPPVPGKGEHAHTHTHHQNFLILMSREFWSRHNRWQSHVSVCLNHRPSLLLLIYSASCWHIWGFFLHTELFSWKNNLLGTVCPFALVLFVMCVCACLSPSGELSSQVLSFAANTIYMAISCSSLQQQSEPSGGSAPGRNCTVESWKSFKWSVGTKIEGRIQISSLYWEKVTQIIICKEFVLVFLTNERQLLSVMPCCASMDLHLLRFCICSGFI